MNAIPADMRAVPRWVLWNGKKLPMQPDGSAASSTDPATWTTFDDAMAAHRTGRFSGIGFVLGDGWAGIDLDNCAVDGEPCPAAQAIIDELDSYTEWSPSGRGIHVIVRAGSKPGDKCKASLPWGAVEIYTGQRYFTVTTNVVPDTVETVEHRQTQLDAIYRRLFPDAKHRRSSPPRLAAADDRVDRCRRYLVHCPDSIEGENGSGAMLRACCEVYRFGLSDDQARLLIDEFNATKCTPPWSDREVTHKLADARRKVEGAGEFGSKLSSHNVHAARLETFQTASPVPAAAPNLTDTGNAIRFARQHHDALRYSPGIGWIAWDGKRWARDDGNLEVMRRAKQVARKIYAEAAAEPDDAKRKRIGDHARQSEDLRRLKAMVELAQSELGMSVKSNEIDADSWLMNVDNGTLDLRTGRLREHRQSDLMTRLAPVEFDPDARCPRFDAFMREIFSGDDALIRFVQRVHGCCLTGDITEQVLFVYYGRGANGKSTLLDTLSWIMGDYAGQAPPSLVTSNRHQEHPTEIADLHGKRLVIASETETDAQFRLQLIKRLTGDSKLKARYMRRDYFEFDRTFKLVLMTNNKPVVVENSEAVWRRLKLVPFSTTIPVDQRDARLLETLRAEGSGILSWCVRGCVDWQQQSGLHQPAAVTEATNKYRGEQDAVGAFIADCCIVDPALSEGSTKLFERFQIWARETGRREDNQTNFSLRLEDLGFTSGSHPTTRRKTRLGIALEKVNVP
jgi:putative DNA primase/helicase